MKITKRDLELSKLDATLLLANQLETLLHTVPELQNAHVEELLRIVPDKRAILRGTLNERDVVFRMHLDQSSNALSKEWEEYQRIWPVMREGPYTVCEPLFHLNDHKILILEAVKGKPFLNVLHKAKRKKRPDHLTLTAQWLRSYIEISMCEEPANHRQRLKRAEKIYYSQIPTRFSLTKDKILVELNRLATHLDGTTWRTAIGHGDFHPNNLIYTKEKLIGIDIGGSARNPIYQYMARFLSHLARREYKSGETHCFGVSQPGFEAFSNVFDLTNIEREIALPFMIGCDALIRPGPSKHTGRNAGGFDAFCNAVLQDLSQIRT